MFCIFCGKEIVHKSKFCIYCGKQLPVKEIQQIHGTLETKNENFETEENHTCEQHTVNSNTQFGLKGKENTTPKADNNLYDRQEIKEEAPAQQIQRSVSIEKPEKTIKICNSCGSENPAEMTFCGRCGTNMYKVDSMSRGSNQGFYQSYSMQHGSQPSNGGAHSYSPYPGQNSLQWEEMKRLASLNGSVGIENSAYLLKVNPMYPVYVPQTKEEKIAVVGLGWQDNWSRVINEKYFTISGRASRGEFWKANVILFLLQIVFLVFLMIIFASGDVKDNLGAAIVSGGIVTIIFILILLLLWIPFFTVQIRRLHDVGRSGWWILITYIPYIGWIPWLYFMCQKGDAHINKYGKPENYYDPTPEERKELGLNQN